MNLATQLFRPVYRLASRVFAVWARPAVQPEVPAELLSDAGVPVCYVLETGGLVDTLALERACRIHGLPALHETVSYSGQLENRRVVVLRRMKGLIFSRPRVQGSKRLRRIVDVAFDPKNKDILLIPVAIYWGRSRSKESPWLNLLFAENWDVAGPPRKLLATLFQGRNTLLRFSDPLPIKSVIQDGLEPEIAYRKVSRILRVHFRQRRIATVGPDLSHRRTLTNAILRDSTVQRIIAQESGNAGATDSQIEKNTREARKYAREIAAHISYPTVRVVERLLGWVWNRIYDGIVLNHVERLHEIANDREIIYVPCHRSHIDYLLLSYVVIQHGLSLPHVAAGINLNFPVVGAILRRGGAFFLRRRFAGNRLYAAVFNAYLHEILIRGHSIEYFVEGGRSRTGRLLAPKAGMLAMTISSYLQDPRRPIVFIPVYFGYEKLIEGNSFISELGGAEKSSESLFGFIRSIRALREDFGKVYVNVGEPIEAEAVISQVKPDWREAGGNGDERPVWITEVIDKLGDHIMRGINSAAAVTPISLLAVVLLSTPKQAIGVRELHRQLRLYMDLLERFHYSESVTVPDWSPDEIVQHGVKLGVITIIRHPLGDVVNMPQHEAVLMTYFRNNVLHLFAIPASIACCFIQGRQIEHNELQRLVGMIYPFMKNELRLKWTGAEIADVTSEAIGALIDLDILQRVRNKNTLVRPPAGSAKAYQLLMLGQSMVSMLQRFYLVIALLVNHGSGAVSRPKLENLCQQSAERLSMIYGLHSPDFFDRALFQNFIAELRSQNVLRRNEQGMLEFEEEITAIGEDARLVLGEEIRHSILSLTFPDAIETFEE